MMASKVSEAFESQLRRQFGAVKRLAGSFSLFEIGGRVRIYRRYSKIHSTSSAFYGLRQIDLRQLEGYESFICLLWDDQESLLVIPFNEFHEVFAAVQPASDGQHKVQVEFRKEGTVIRIGRAGKFGVDSHFGFERIARAIEQQADAMVIPDLSHSQVQSLLGAIGNRSGYAIWTPVNDRSSLEFDLCGEFPLANALPEFGSTNLQRVIEQIDMIWLDAFRNTICAAFEIEFSTPIYSGLLRFNDVHIDFKLPRAAVVAHDQRRDAFVRQVNRRTFQVSGLNEVCAFYECEDVYRWFQRVCHTK